MPALWISDATFYTWRSKYGGLEISELHRLRQLEEENRRPDRFMLHACLPSQQALPYLWDTSRG